MNNKMFSFIIILVLTSICDTGFAQQTPNFQTDFGAKIRAQGTTSNKGFGLSGVFELSNLTSTGPFAGAGVSYANKHTELALHAGFLSTPDSIDEDYHYFYSPVVDFRGTIKYNDNIFSWFNINLTNVNDLYRPKTHVFAMTDYQFSGKLKNVGLGVETSNKINLGMPWYYRTTSDFSVGPNVLLIFTQKIRMEMSLQLHTVENPQFWMRLNTRF